ncbi:uncharacterized protein [Coffea arabica]|uniref:RNase H type-1 domain-containing protein n=1 Tax=Coffea arabica TaxID=13443 RepID=A0ABM4VQP7_COFAR
MARFQASSFTADQVIFQIERFLGQIGRGVSAFYNFLLGDWDCLWTGFARARYRKTQIDLMSWRRPSRGWLKLNSDASMVHGRASRGGVLQDHGGKVFFAYYKEFGKQDVLSAEAMSLLEGLKLCANQGYSSLVVESDSRVLVNMVCFGALSKWPLCNLLREIRHWLEKLNGSLHHMYREANSVTDTLASLQLRF